MSTPSKITIVACTITATLATFDGITTLVTGGGFPFWQTTTVLLAVTTVLPIVATVVESRRPTTTKEP